MVSIAGMVGMVDMLCIDRVPENIFCLLAAILTEKNVHESA